MDKSSEAQSCVLQKSWVPVFRGVRLLHGNRDRICRATTVLSVAVECRHQGPGSGWPEMVETERRASSSKTTSVIDKMSQAHLLQYAVTLLSTARSLLDPSCRWNTLYGFVECKRVLSWLMQYCWIPFQMWQLFLQCFYAVDGRSGICSL